MEIDPVESADAHEASAKLLALTSFTHQRSLYWIATVPTTLGVLMGVAGLFGWPIHPRAIAQLLS